MPPIRVGVGKMPRLLHEIIMASLAQQDGMEVVDMADAGTNAGAWLDRKGCHVLVLSSDRSELPPEMEALLTARSWLRIVAIEAEGRQAALYEATDGAGPRRHPVGEVSMERLAAVIRTSVAPPDSEE